MVSLGYAADGKRIRKKVSGQTRTEVKDKLKALHSELDAGVRTVQGYADNRVRQAENGCCHVCCGLRAATTMMTALVIPAVIASSGRPINVMVRALACECR